MAVGGCFCEDEDGEGGWGWGCHFEQSGMGRSIVDGVVLGDMYVDMDVIIIVIRLNGFWGRFLYLTSFIPAEEFV